MSGVIQKHYVTKTSNSDKDSWILLQSGNFAKIKEINVDDTYECDIIKKQYFQSIFHELCEIKLFQIIYVRSVGTISRRKNVKKCSFLRKALYRPYKEGCAIMPLLHNVILR